MLVSTAASAAAIALGLAALALGVPRVLRATGIALRLRRGRRQRTTDLRLAAAYHEHARATTGRASLDERTWQDLDLDVVFDSLDHTASEPGRQLLYHLLRTPHHQREPLERLEEAVRRVSADDALVARLRGALALLDDPRAGQLVGLATGELPPRPLLWPVYPLLTATSLACLVLAAVWPRALIVWLAVCAINVLVQLLYKPRVKRFIPALHEVPALVRAASMLGEANAPELAHEAATLARGAARLAPMRRAALWLMFEPGQTNELAASLYEYANLLFLLDVNAFIFAAATLRATRTLLLDTIAAVGYIDAVQSIAAWRATLARWTTPDFTARRKALQVVALVHPLLSEAVPNSLAVSDASVLVTGSNMAGKTTFVRAVGVNAVLAQTLHTVCADAWRAPMLDVRTSIGRVESVVEGRSYYLAEVESVRTLVRAKESGDQHLFLLDEIFRGTNTAERIAAGRAVLAWLDRGDDIVLVATHDLELVDLLGARYAPFHFREHIEDDVLRFDYRIHDGPSSTTNAIALLALMEYPTELVSDALATVARRKAP